MSVEEYFQLRESDPDHHYEYINGEVFLMTGGSPRHSAIGANMCRILGNLLEEGPCIVYNSDACVQLSEEQYVCPDATVSCDPRDYDDEDSAKTVQHPRFVVEVLSPGTKARDRGIKAELYQEHPTIQEFLLVDAEFPKVQLYRRESNNRWTIYILNMNDEVELASLGVRFPVANLYRKTRFAR
ncbi:MAG: Uma2 family endonuclease [Rhabdochlamydiaceae bacterium]